MTTYQFISEKRTHCKTNTFFALLEISVYGGRIIKKNPICIFKHKFVFRAIICILINKNNEFLRFGCKKFRSPPKFVFSHSLESGKVQMCYRVMRLHERRTQLLCTQRTLDYIRCHEKNSAIGTHPIVAHI